MLPGLRFLFGAIVLSASVLVFGFGAAALLRTAHEEFASAPAWRPAPETRFAVAHEATQPTLALLRVEDTPKPAVKAEPPAPGDIPANAAAEPAVTPSPQPDLDQTAALQPTDAPPSSDAARSDADPAQNPPQPETTATAAETPAATEQTKVATTEQPSADTQAQIAAPAATPVTSGTAPAGDIAAAPPEAAPAGPEQASLPAPAKADSFSTRIATLGGPAVKIVPDDLGPKPDPNVIRKRQAHRAAHRRRRIALRATPQQRALQQQQQQLNPFTPLPVAR